MPQILEMSFKSNCGNFIDLFLAIIGSHLPILFKLLSSFLTPMTWLIPTTPVQIKYSVVLLLVDATSFTSYFHILHNTAT